MITRENIIHFTPNTRKSKTEDQIQGESAEGREDQEAWIEIPREPNQNDAPAYIGE